MQKKLLQNLLMAAILSPGVGMAADTISTISQSSNHAITHSTILAQNELCGCIECTTWIEQVTICTPGCTCSKEESKASSQK